MQIQKLSGQRKGAVLGVNFGRPVVTSGDVVDSNARAMQSSQITLVRTCSADNRCMRVIGQADDEVVAIIVSLLYCCDADATIYIAK